MPEKVNNKAAERTCALREMLPGSIVKVFDVIGNAIVWSYRTFCDASWIFFTIGLILLAPPAFEKEREIIEDKGSQEK
jgi:hypothetical protein